MEEEINRPKCTSCGEPMMYSFCIMYNEYVCIPCGIAKPMFGNGCDTIKTTEEKERKLKEKYKDDIKFLAFTQGGASCSKCNKTGGNNCPTCKLPEELKDWGKN